MFYSLGFIIKQALISLKRNFWLSFASVLTAMLALTLLGFAVLFIANMQSVMQTMISHVQIVAYVQEEVSEETLSRAQQEIKRLDGVAKITVISKDEALKRLYPSDAERETLISDMGGINPLPVTLLVDAKEIELVEGLALTINDMAEIDSVKYGEGYLENLINLNRWLRWIGLAVVGAFVLATMLLISLNIKTNVQAREKEVQIMRLVGAENFLIRGPFFIEGLLIGFLGALLSVAIVGSIYFVLINYISSNLSFLPVVFDKVLLDRVLGAMIGAGMALGALASAFSIRRFLRF